MIQAVLASDGRERLGDRSRNDPSGRRTAASTDRARLLLVDAALPALTPPRSLDASPRADLTGAGPRSRRRLCRSVQSCDAISSTLTARRAAANHWSQMAWRLALTLAVISLVQPAIARADQ